MTCCKGIFPLLVSFAHNAPAVLLLLAAMITTAAALGIEACMLRIHCVGIIHACSDKTCSVAHRSVRCVCYQACSSSCCCCRYQGA